MSAHSSSSPISSYFASEGASTAPSSPPPEDYSLPHASVFPIKLVSILISFQNHEEQHRKLNDFLERTSIYATAMKRNMEDAKFRALERLSASRVVCPQPKSKKGSPRKGKSKKRVLEDLSSEDYDDAVPSSKRMKLDSVDGERRDQESIFPQPTLLTGVKMKNYQLEGLQWMIALHQNDLSGILGLHRLEL
jgi:ATP-dependent DNA helicase